MKQYDKIYVPHPTGDYEVFEIGFEDPERGRLINEENVIVLTASELIALMQECIEYSHPVLTRDAADKFLASKLK